MRKTPASTNGSSTARGSFRSRSIRSDWARMRGESAATVARRSFGSEFVTTDRTILLRRSGYQRWRRCALPCYGESPHMARTRPKKSSSRIRVPAKRKSAVSARARERRPVALVTGASSGIGKELAKVFAANGFDLVLVSRRRGPLEKLAAFCASAHGTGVTVLPADLLDPAAPKRIYDALRRKRISIEVLVNNAGIAIVDHFVTNPLAAQLDLIRLNVVAPTALARLFLPDMIKREKGRVMNVASVAAFQPTPNLAVYGASKAFILSLSESLTIELEGTGVTVTALCPGFTETPLVENVEKRLHNPGIVPSFFMLDAAAVAKQGYEACMAGTPVCINGLTYELLVCLERMQPRWAVRRVASMISQRFHDPADRIR